jgi:ATP-binding cassette subfamily B protein
MRENYRALVLLVQSAWRTDPWRSIGLLLEPIGYLQYPLYAWCFKVMVDGTVHHDRQTVLMGAIVIAATRVLWFAAMWTGSWIRVRLKESVGFAFEQELAGLVAGFPGLEHQERPDVQDKLELLRQAHGEFGESFNSLIQTANTIFLGIGTLLIVAFACPWLLVLVAFCIPTFVFGVVQQKWLRKAEEESAPVLRRFRDLRTLAMDRHAGMEVRVFGLCEEILSRLERSGVASMRSLLDAGRRAAILDTLGDLIYFLGCGGMLVWMLWGFRMGRVTFGDVVMAAYLGKEIKESVAAPVQTVVRLGRVLRAASRILWLQSYTRSLQRSTTGHSPEPARVRDSIVLDQVSFRYPGTERWILRDVSFRIPAGSTVAIVGENGSGKTTLVKLLCRLYEPTSGGIRVDGLDLTRIRLEGWRSRCCGTFQDFARLEFTAQRSIGLGDLPRLDDPSAVLSASERAGRANLKTILPHGLDSMLGTRWEGTDLSVGQWQHVALSRGLMRDSPLLVILDEPTASLDAFAEHALFERYIATARSASVRGAVTLLVSHRFSTVRSADLIIVIDAGCVVEQGRHDELLQQGGLYSRLYQSQARAYS